MIGTFKWETGHNSVMNKDKYTEPMTGRMDPVMIESAQRKGSAVFLQPAIFLEIAVPRIPGVFLKLAMEARNSNLLYDRISVMSADNSQWLGRSRRQLITEIVDSGPAGLVRTHCPVGTVMLPALRDEFRPVAGSPVDTLPDPVFKKCRQIPSGNDSYQPFITGPSGANVSDDGQDTGKPWVSDPMIRPSSSDPLGDGDIGSPNEGCQSTTVCKKICSPDNSYQPLITGPTGANVSEDGHDTGHPRNTDTYIGQIGFAPMNPSAESEGNEMMVF